MMTVRGCFRPETVCSGFESGCLGVSDPDLVLDPTLKQQHTNTDDIDKKKIQSSQTIQICIKVTELADCCSPYQKTIWHYNYLWRVMENIRNSLVQS